jgi:hypothetical protein
VIGSQVDISGSVSEGVDEVAIYARGGSNWERVDLDNSDTNQFTIGVDGDNTFEQEDVTLSDTAGNDGNQLLSLPGSYKIAVVDAAKLGDTPQATLTTAQFNDNTTDSQTIVVDLVRTQRAVRVLQRAGRQR